MNAKKFFAALLALVLCVSMLAACGNGNSNGNDTPDDGGNNGAAGDTIKIGFIGPLTGNTAQYGNAVKNGAQMRIDEINEAGGINGATVELIAEDSTGDATEATNAYSKLVDQDGVVAIVGPVLTGETFAVAELAADDGFPLITASATGDAITDIGSSLFRTCFKDSFQGGKMGAYAAEKLGLTKVAVLTNSGSDYSVGLAKAFVEACNEANVEVVAEEKYADGDTDFAAQLTNIASSGCEAIYVPDYYEIVALIAQQAKSVGVNVPFLGGDGYDGVIEQSEDAANVEGFYFTTHYSSDADTTGWVDTYTSNYNVAPMSFSYLAYDAMMVLENALKNAASYDKADLVAAIKATDMECLTSHYTFDEDNNPIKDCMIITVENGAYKYVEMY